MAKKKSEKKLPPRLLILIILVLVVVVLLLIFLSWKRTTPQILKEVYTKSLPLVNNNHKLEQNFEDNLWWISENGYSILVPARTVTFAVKGNAVPNSGDPFKDIMSDINMATFYNQSIEILKQNGFSKDAKNTGTFYDKIEAYKRGTTVCTVKVDPESWAPLLENGPKNLQQYYYITTACSDQFDKSYEKQYPFLKSLQLKDSIISNTKEPVKDYFVLSINGRRSGYYAVVKKQSDGYKMLYSGQDIPPCELVDSLKVPKAVYGQCFTNEKR